MRIRRVLCLAVLVFAVAQVAVADPVPISGYDINDAVISGHGNWGHTYSGTITPGASFVNNTWPGTQATYSGVGNGTLTNGVIESTEGTTQLFINGTATDGTMLSPVIFLTLPFEYTINTMDLFGGTISDNAIPGAITGLTVEFFGSGGSSGPVVFSTTDFGSLNLIGVPVNDHVDFTGSALDGFGAFLVILSDFQGEVANWVSLAEIQLDGQLAPPVTPIPAPGAVILGALGMSIMGGARVIRKRIQKT